MKSRQANPVLTKLQKINGALDSLQKEVEDAHTKIAAGQMGGPGAGLRDKEYTESFNAHTRNAKLASNAAACGDLADQHQRLAALAAGGAGLVGDLGSLVQKRDAQVSLLRGQIAADRALLKQMK